MGTETMPTQSNEETDAEYEQKIHSRLSGGFIAACIAVILLLMHFANKSDAEPAPDPFNNQVLQENLVHMIHCDELAELLRTTPYEDANYNSIDTQYNQECRD